MSDALVQLANSIDACVEDALQTTPVPGLGPDYYEAPDHRIICLANGLRAISATLRALAKEPTP